jgi:hypothetical protein
VALIPLPYACKRCGRAGAQGWNLPHSRAFRRAVRNFAKDGDCSEAQAKEWLASIGVTEPASNGGNGKK